MKKETFSLLRTFFLLGTVILLFSCHSPKKEIHIHDRHSNSYKVIKDFVARTSFGPSPPPALVLIDQYSGIGFDSEEWAALERERQENTALHNALTGCFISSWIENLLQENVISAVHWIPAIADLMELEQKQLPKNCIVSVDLGILAQEKYSPSVEFLESILKWLNKQKPVLLTVALSGAYQHSSADMYSFLTTALQSLSYRAAVYLESETAMKPENTDELYRWQNWYGPVSPDKSLDPNIRPDPWIWYALPPECIELFKKKKVIIKGENRENILTVWNDPAYKKLKPYDSGRLQEILQSARESIFRVWNNAETPSLPPAGTNEGLAVRLLVLGKDRGCLAWYKNSGDMKLFAAYCAAEALRDSRYEPVRPEEANSTLLELAILGGWEDVSDPEDFIPGYHNLLLADGVHITILQAPLVPQRRYTKEAFLENLCVKAGFEKDAWRENKNLKWQRSVAVWYSEAL